MNLLIIYSKNPNEVFNRKSAIGSYINCLADILHQQGISVFLNGIAFQLNTEKQSESNVSPRGIKQMIKRIVPPVIKRFLRDFQQLKSVDNFADQMLDSSDAYDAILEFYNIGSEVGLKMAEKFNIPLYITYDGPILEEYLFFNNALPFFKKKIVAREKRSLEKAKKIIVYSEPMKVHISQKIEGVANIEIHQNIDFTRFDVLETKKKVESGPISICFIGSFLKWHQVDYLVGAFKKLVAEGYNVNLYLVGDGQQKEAISKLVSSCDKQVQEQIIFTGFLDGTELRILKEQMDIGVMPGSNWYGAPNKIFEYGAMQMAVVAPDTPTISDLFNKREVVLFEWKNEGDLYVKLKSLVDSNEKVKLMAERLHKRVLDNHSAKLTGQFYRSVFEQ